MQHSGQQAGPVARVLLPRELGLSAVSLKPPPPQRSQHDSTARFAACYLRVVAIHVHVAAAQVLWA